MSAAARVALDAFSPASCRALRELAALAEPGSCWLVGGAVRDALLGEPVTEVDVAVAGSALSLGRALAARLPGAGFVVLDEARAACRVVAGVQVDIARLRAATLAEDLRLRDFTVNALAADLHELTSRGAAPVVALAGGLADLAARRISACAPTAIREDPVRALRAVRLALRLGGSLDAALETAIREAAPGVAGVSAERVRAELIAILAQPGGGAGLRALDRLGVLEILFPESRAMRATAQPAPHRFDVWEHSLRAVDAADLIVADLAALEPWGPELADHLALPLGDGVTRRTALKLAALLHDVAKPETRSEEDGRVRFLGHDVVGAERVGTVADRWRLSRHTADVLRRLVAQHLRPMHLAQAGGVSRRARYRFFRDLGGEARDLVLLALADAAAVRGEPPLAVWNGPGGSILRELLRGAGEADAGAGAPPLLRGEDVMRAFGLAPGPAVGRLLAQAREAQALGLVASRPEAIEYLRRAEPPLLDTPGGGP